MNQQKRTSLLIKDKVTHAALIVLGVFALALMFPEKLWGVHHYTFLTSGSVVMLIAALLVIWRAKTEFKLPNYSFFTSTIGIVLVAVIAGCCFYNFPIHNDYYGDAPRHKQFMGEHITSLNKSRTDHLYSLNLLDPKNGEKTVLNAVEKIAYYTKMKVVDVFKWLDTISGIAFILIWLFFINASINNKQLKFVLMLLGIFAPFLQLFFGHIEIYAPVIPFITAYLFVLLKYFNGFKKRLLWVLALLLVFCLKFHFISILLLPSFLFALFYKTLQKRNWLMNWKSMLKWVIIPVILFGWELYFFYFKDYNDPRFLNGNVRDLERLFLPIISPDAPLDRYSLFSFNHILDFFNVIFLWSGAGVFLLLVMVFKREKTNWNSPASLIMGVSLVFFLCFYFMINPLLSMPMDWDLFSISGPLFLVFLVSLLQQVQEEKWMTRLVWPVLIFSIFGVAIFATNHLPKANNARLVSLGKHTFKTYWIRSVATIMAGLDDKSLEYGKNLESIVEELTPYANADNDKEFAILLMNTGKYFRTHEQVQKGLDFHLKAKHYAPDYPVNYIGLMESYYRLNYFDKALMMAEKLIGFSYPDEASAYRMAIDCAKQANNHEKVVIYCNRYLKIHPEDDAIRQLRDKTPN